MTFAADKKAAAWGLRLQLSSETSVLSFASDGPEPTPEHPARALARTTCQIVEMWRLRKKS